MLDYELLRLIWWLLLGILIIGFAIMDGFDIGVAILIPFIGKTDIERRLIINSIGPVWEGNQVWFILGGGAIFAAWPLVYAVSFSSFYLVMLFLLMAFILRPVAFKFRSKIPTPIWRNAWDYILSISGFIMALVFGIAVGNVLLGVPFQLDETFRMSYSGNFWQLFSFFAILCGLLSISMLLMHGCLYLSNKLENPVKARALTISLYAGVLLILLFAFAGIWVSQYVEGYQISSVIQPNAPSNPLLKQVEKILGGWTKNYDLFSWIIISPILGIGGAIFAILLRKQFSKIAFISSSFSIFGIISTVGLSMYPFILPSSTQPNASLVIWDASSSQLTLFIMLIATIIFFPIILIYTSWIYKVMRGSLKENFIKSETNAY